MAFDARRFLIDRGLLADRAAVTVAPLTGGYWNETLRVRGGGVDWVVKAYRSSAGQTLFPNLPEAEARALEALAGRAVAPAPVGFFPASDAVGDDDFSRPVLVYEFHDGAPWRRGAAAVAGLLRRQHGIAADGFRTLAMAPAAILEQGDRLLALAGTDALAGAARARRPAMVDGPPPRARALVHTDAGPGNLIDGPAGLRLIDWQCPGLGDPAEDLWSFASPGFQILSERAPLDRAERAAFLAAYDDAEVAGRLRYLEPYLAYRMIGYCCQRRGQLSGRDDAAAARYARAIAAQMPLLDPA